MQQRLKGNQKKNYFFKITHMYISEVNIRDQIFGEKEVN